MRISFLLLFTIFVAVQSWDCGSGKVSTFFAWVISLPASDRSYINDCCRVHDQQYDAIEDGTANFTPELSDYLFKLCLEKSDHVYTKTVISHTYHYSVALNSFVQKKLSQIKCIFTDC
uniref:Aspergillus nuclease S(1) n=1 Tax=Caenorhabditis tropicalis TaxID=1561998 RepID=A0A1I7T5Q0_9PELO